ncbi:MAG: hypothetical protein N3I86_09385 [Verrucomicrobiae bacterium]|nr:hypothetical protein [Verrucomicrobiae bacterium]
MKQSDIAKLINLIAATICLMVIGAAYDMLVGARYAVSVRTLERIRVGTSADEVKKMIGEPTQIYDFGDGNIWWAYYRQNSWGVVYVIFDTNKMFIRYEIDSFL